MCFFARWYAEQTERRRREAQALVAAGRLEFVGGGWVQHDEATCTVSAILDSMAEGHAWLRDTFGVEPTVGWQIDTFGHAASSAALLSQMGLAAQVINRIHWRQKNEWRSFRHLEFNWRGVPALGGSAVPLMHVLHTHYSAPKGFDFEGDPFKRSDQRGRQSARDFRNLVLKRADAYRTKHVMVLVGDDFRWKRSVYVSGCPPSNTGPSRDDALRASKT